MSTGRRCRRCQRRLNRQARAKRVALWDGNVHAWEDRPRPRLSLVLEQLARSAR